MASAYTRTALFNQVQPGGVHSIADVTEHPGNIWHVDSGETTNGGDTAGHGQNPDYPFLTIDYAVGRCTANNGDVIYVYPGHAENITAAGTITLDVQGITIIGLGVGDDRPTLTWTAVDATIAVDDCDITMKHFIFAQGIDVIVVMVDVNSDDFTLEDIEFAEAAAAQAVCFVDLNGGGANTCDNFTMRDCRVIQPAAGADQVVDIATVQDGMIIENNYMDVDCENGCIYSPAILTDCLIKDNILNNRQAGDHALEFSAAATGHIINNHFFGDTLGTILDPGECFCSGNLESDAINQCAVPTPRTAAGGAPANWIDADAIATDAIDADAIAANAIGAAEIADGAIDAATFAAGAINAAAIADAAIDVATYATDISTWQLDTATSTTALTSGTIFTYTGSIEFYVIGRVTDEVAVALTNTQLTVTPDALGAYAICTNLDISGFDVGSILSITGTAADAMLGTDAQGAMAPGQADPVYATCVTNGVISTVFGAATAGAIVWELLWRPLSAGATVTPA